MLPLTGNDSEGQNLYLTLKYPSLVQEGKCRFGLIWYISFSFSITALLIKQWFLQSEEDGEGRSGTQTFREGSQIRPGLHLLASIGHTKEVHVGSYSGSSPSMSPHSSL
jgi:hypothetical protein